MSGGKSSSSNSTSSKSTTIDSKQTADGEAVVARADGGDVIINQTLDDAVLVAEDALNSVDNAVSENGETFYQALKFAEGWLTVNEIYNLATAAPLVTLSACETGRNKISIGDELMGLCRGFFGIASFGLFPGIVYQNKFCSQRFGLFLGF